MKLQFTLIFLILCLVLVSCSDSNNKVDNGNHAGGEIASDFEYAVYRALIEQIYIPVNSDTFPIQGGDEIEHMVIDNETFFNYNYSLDLASEYDHFGGWNAPGSSELKESVLPDTYNSFLQRNQQTQTIDCSKLALSVPCTSISRAEAERDEIFTRAQDVWDFQKIYPGSFGIVQLSRIGFDTERNQALVYAGNQFHHHESPGYPAYVFLFLREQENFESGVRWRHDAWFSHNDDIWFLHDFSRLAVERPSNGVDVEIVDNETVSSTPWAGTWTRVSVNGKRIQSLLYNGEIVEGIPTDQVIDEIGDDPDFELKLQNAPHGNKTVQDVLIDGVRVDEIMASRDRFINEIIAEGLLGDILIDTSNLYGYSILGDIYEGKLLVEDIPPNHRFSPRLFLTTRLRLNRDGTMEADMLDQTAGIADGGRFDAAGRVEVGGRRDWLAYIALLSGNGIYHLSSYRYSFRYSFKADDPSGLTSYGSWLREGNTLTLVGDNGITAVFKKIDD